jgi:hypothetical protein
VDRISLSYPRSSTHHGNCTAEEISEFEGV